MQLRNSVPGVGVQILLCIAIRHCLQMAQHVQLSELRRGDLSC